MQFVEPYKRWDCLLEGIIEMRSQWQTINTTTNEEYYGGKMKKYTAIILALILLIISAGSSDTYAAKIVSRGQSATGRLMDVKYSSNESSESVTITAKNYVDYSVMELSDPKRIVLDIFNLEAPGKQQIVMAGGKNIKRIRYAQFDTYTARVVIEVKREAEYGVEISETGLVLYIGGKPVVKNQGKDVTTTKGTASTEKTPAEVSSEKTIPDQVSPAQTTPVKIAPVATTPVKITPVVTTSVVTTTEGTDPTQTTTGKQGSTVQQLANVNIEYHNKGDRVYFILRNAVLTEGDEFLKELYTGSYDDSGKKYTLTFTTGRADIGNGIMGINDKYIQTVEVKTNRDEGTTSLTFNGTGMNSYFAYTRGSSGVTSITVLKPATKTQKLVVIDAGHGGIATGAIYKNLFEKDLNLDIAKRLNTLLKKKGVKTYMLREDDSDIANYERAYIANKLDAKLYLSVHNNAMDDKYYRGTMTLYCPSNSGNGFTGKSFADIIHSKMLGSLKTVDRKVNERPDLIVLKATAMPAALAEVAFMTNSTDRSNLQKATFRQKAAQSLCDAVVKALSKVK